VKTTPRVDAVSHSWRDRSSSNLGWTFRWKEKEVKKDYAVIWIMWKKRKKKEKEEIDEEGDR